MAGADTIQKQSTEFFYCVGLAITDWAHIERELFQICATILKAEPQHTAIVYYRTPTLDARLALIDELLETVFPKPKRKNGGHPHSTEKLWRSLLLDMKNELKIRNHIAHSPAMPMAHWAVTENVTAGLTDIWWASYMSDTEKLRGSSANKQELKIDDIKHHLKRITALFIRLRDFRNVLSTLLQSLQKLESSHQ